MKPPDLTLTAYYVPGLRPCNARHDGYVCTRLEGHTGRHAAGTGRVIVEVWS